MYFLYALCVTFLYVYAELWYMLICDYKYVFYELIYDLYFFLPIRLFLCYSGVSIGVRSAKWGHHWVGMVTTSAR